MSIIFWLVNIYMHMRFYWHELHNPVEIQHVISKKNGDWLRVSTIFQNDHQIENENHNIFGLYAFLAPLGSLDPRS